jgi:hypothetical protein
VQNWVESSGADFVTVAAKLFQHAQTEDRFLASVMEHVQADQPGVKIAIVAFGHPFRLT